MSAVLLYFLLLLSIGLRAAARAGCFLLTRGATVANVHYDLRAVAERPRVLEQMIPVPSVSVVDATLDQDTRWAFSSAMLGISHRLAACLVLLVFVGFVLRSEKHRRDVLDSALSRSLCRARTSSKRRHNRARLRPSSEQQPSERPVSSSRLFDLLDLREEHLDARSRQWVLTADPAQLLAEPYSHSPQSRATGSHHTRWELQDMRVHLFVVGAAALLAFLQTDVNAMAAFGYLAGPALILFYGVSVTFGARAGC